MKTFSDCIFSGARAEAIREIVGNFSWDDPTHAYMVECVSCQPLISWAQARGFSATVRSGSECPDHPHDGETWTVAEVEADRG